MSSERGREASPEAQPLATLVEELDLATVSLEELEALAGVGGGGRGVVGLTPSPSPSPSLSPSPSPSLSPSVSPAGTGAAGGPSAMGGRMAMGGPLAHSFALLQAEVREKDAVLANIRKQHLLELKVLQEQVRGLMGERARAEKELDRRERAHARTVAALKAKHSGALADVRAQLAAIEERQPVVQSRMALAAADVAALRLVSAAQYAKLTARPPAARSLAASLAIKTYELTQGVRDEAAAAAAAARAADDAVAAARADAQRLTRERDALAAKTGALESELASATAMAAKDSALLAAKLNAARDELADVKDAAASSIHAASQLASVRSELARTKSTVAELRALLRAEEDARASAAGSAAAAEAEAKVLASSVGHLKSQVAAAESAGSEAHSALQTALAENARLRSDQDALYAKFLAFKASNESAFEGRLSELVSLFTSNSQATLATVSDATSGAYERELKLLREARDSAAAEIRYLKNKLDTAESAHAAVLGEYQALQLSLSSSAALQASQLTSKTIELERLNITHAALVDAHARLGIHCDALQQKLDIATAAYTTLEDDAAAAAAAARDELADLRLALATAAASAPHAPPSPARQRAAATHAASVAELEREVAMLRVKLDDALAYAAAVSQPQEFLARTVLEKDAELARAHAALRAANASLASATADLDRARHEKDGLARDLLKLLDSRKDMSALRTMVADLKRSAHPRPPADPVADPDDPDADPDADADAFILPGTVNRAARHADADSGRRPAQQGPAARDARFRSTSSSSLIVLRT